MAGEGDLEENYLTCYICFDVFSEPKTLVCLHRFCEKCLEGYLVGLPQSTVAKKSFPCPVCRELTPAPDTRRPAADWACLLRTDFHLKSFIKALKTAGGGRGPGRSNPCPSHADKDRDLYCVDCSSVMCHLCAGISHRRCSQVVTLSEAAADRRATVDLQCGELADRLATMAQLRADIDSAADGLDGQQKKAEASIRQSCEAAIAVVLLQEKQQLRELGQTFTSIREDLSTRLGALDGRMAQCQQALESVRKKMTSSSDTDVVLQETALTDHTVLDVDEKKVHNILHRLKNIRIEFHPSTNRSLTKLGDMSISLGPLKKKGGGEGNHATKEPTNTSSSPRTSSMLRPPVPARRSRSKTVATMELTAVTQTPVRLRTIPGRFREDQHSPKLRDVLVLPGMKVVLVTDWANQCVKAFHERRERDSRLEVGGKPWCVARVTDTAVAVSLPVSARICVIKVTPRLTLQSSFFAQKRYSGLAALNSDTLVASGGSDPPCVDIINLGGEVLRSFSRDVTTGQKLFLYPAYIALMPDRKHFVVSDRRRGALVCLGTSGQLRFVLRPDGNKALQEPNGVRTDRAGRLCVVEARGVVRVTAEGRLDRALLTSSRDGLEDPRGLDFDQDGLMYVTNREEEVVVFKV